MWMKLQKIKTLWIKISGLAHCPCFVAGELQRGVVEFLLFFSLILLFTLEETLNLRTGLQGWAGCSSEFLHLLPVRVEILELWGDFRFLQLSMGHLTGEQWLCSVQSDFCSNYNQLHFILHLTSCVKTRVIM